MGHKLPGSRGSYFDYHDVDEAAEKYLQADWSRNGNGNGRIRVLEEENKQLKDELANLRSKLDSVASQVHLVTAKMMTQLSPKKRR